MNGLRRGGWGDGAVGLLVGEEVVDLEAEGEARGEDVVGEVEDGGRREAGEEGMEEGEGEGEGNCYHVHMIMYKHELLLRDQNKVYLGEGNRVHPSYIVIDPG